MSIYKECDIRGVYQTDITQNEALLIGKAIGTVLKGNNVIVAGDTRTSTPILKKALIEGLLSTGSHVIDIGMVPTPLLYFAKKELKSEGAVMVTASHNPARYNGFKIAIGEMPIVPENIEEIKNLVESRQFLVGEGQYTQSSIVPQYLKMIESNINSHGSLSIVVDCGNGATSDLAPMVISNMGHNVIPLFCECKGDFPNRDPNPSVEQHITKLKEKVISHKADMGFAFDGDGDRVIFIDDKGRYCNGESIFTIFSRYYLSKSEHGKIVYDGKASSIVSKYIKEAGGIPVPERSGHAFIKKRFITEGAILAGEVSGHYFFKELGHDDGLYGALKFCEILLKNNEKLSHLMDTIEKPLITPDIRVYYDEAEREHLLDHVRKVGSEFSLSFLDGVRVDYPYGWILVRKSVTEPCVTIRLEADSFDDAKKITAHLFASRYKKIEENILESLDH